MTRTKANLPGAGERGMLAPALRRAEGRMARMVRAWSAMAASALVTVALFAVPALAAGTYDGTWVLDIPSSMLCASYSTFACPALRLETKIADNKVIGSFERVPSGAANTVETGTGRASAPVTGSVQADGMLVADWEGYHASGRLAGDSGQIVVHGQCGPRIATATRVAL
jgi:hypothetical protein